MQPNIPCKGLLFGTLFSVIPLYFDLPYVLIAFIFINSVKIAYDHNLIKAVIFYLILTYFIPLNFLNGSTGSPLGLIFNEYFFAGIPLYLCLPGLLFGKELKSNRTKIQKFILYSTIIILAMTNIIPGILHLFDLGGYRIRLIYLFNFINGLIVFYFISALRINRKLITVVSDCLIFCGLISALLGIFQYLFKIPIIPNTHYIDLSRLNTLNMDNAVDCSPYLFVPFIIAITKLFHSRRASKGFAFVCLIIFVAVFLTFSRAAIFSVVIAILLTLWSNRKRFAKTAFFVLMILVSLSPIVFVIAQEAKRSEIQMERLTSSNNLSVRVYLWGLGLTAIYDNPVGYGLGNSVDAMFNRESEFRFLEENSTHDYRTFKRQSVHQFFLDYMMGLGVSFGIILVLIFLTLYKESKKAVTLIALDVRYFYISINIITIALFIFYLQNVGPQSFYLFLFLAFFRNGYRLQNS